MSAYILSLNQIDSEHHHEAGHHGVRLGSLAKENLPIPGGFVVTIGAYNKFKEENFLDQKVRHLINTIDFRDPYSISQVSKHIKRYFLESGVPKTIVNEIFSNYKRMAGILNDTKVSVRLSPLAKHVSTNHFPEEISGESSLIEKIKECWAMNYDENHLLIGFNNPRNKHFPSAILVQKLVEPDKSGKIYTQNPYKNSKSELLIKASYGNYEENKNLISTPDEYEVDKSDFSIISRGIFPQQKMKKGSGSSQKTEMIAPNLRKKQKLTDGEINELAKLGKQIQNIYYFPQEIDWSIQKNQIYLTRVSPMTDFRHHTLS